MTSPVSSASSAAASIFSSATSSAKESPVHAAATAYAGVKSAEGFSYATVAFISLTCIITALAIIAAGVYFSGYSDDVASWWAKRYYKAKAVAEVKVLENTGVESVHSLVTDSLKKNPVMGEDELEQVSGGLGKEAAQQGLGGASDKLGGLGKL
ncbi:hypothetical protein H2198_006641 [Neophaeococcomyces mojaviensis]|uniref:Uncharacterized protein n=1 Tax=Neophaeococcomyces mojaviensis TaxID=3383035 RepID=A0ACC3A268_9EURO|nr:hypothetical protein H2198_006641 [Knufia sp. JES_112]